MVHPPDALLDPHRVPGQVVVDDDVGELQVQTFPTGVGRDEDAGLLCELPLHPPPLLQVHRPVEAHDREAVLLQEVPQHVLRRHELGEDQVLQLRVVLIPLVLVEDAEQRLGPCVRPLGLTAAGQFEQQLDLLLLVLKASQANRQQFFQLLLAVLLLDVVFGRLLVRGRQVRGLQRFEAAFHRRGNGLRAAGDEPLHQDHQESEILPVLPHRLVVTLSNVFGDGFVEFLLKFVFMLPLDRNQPSHTRHEQRFAAIVDGISFFGANNKRCYILVIDRTDVRKGVLIEQCH